MSAVNAFFLLLIEVRPLKSQDRPEDRRAHHCCKANKPLAACRNCYVGTRVGTSSRSLYNTKRLFH